MQTITLSAIEDKFYYFIYNLFIYYFNSIEIRSLMDDLDNFFGDDAAKAFADAIDIRMDTEEGIGMLSGNNLNTEGREAQDEFFQAMLTHDDIILSAQFGDDWEK